MVDKEMQAFPPIPIAWVVFIALQTGGGFYWAASLESRVETLQAIATHISINDNRLSRIEAQLIDIQRRLERFEARLSPR